MKVIEKLILMYKDFEVLSFSVDLERQRVKVLQRLEHFDKAPHCVLSRLDEDRVDAGLLTFFHGHSIPDTRTGYEEIMKALNCDSGFELTFRGHGLSLSNNYWFKRPDENLKYEDINFFTNKWDDSFAKAVLHQDYEALKHCDLNVPDIMTAGWGTKGWICEEDGPKLYKLGIHPDHCEEALGEYLASRIAKRIFGEEQVVDFDLKKVGERYASVSPLITSIDEELIPLFDCVDQNLYAIYRAKNNNKNLSKLFFDKLKEVNIPGLFEFFIKLAVFKDLCFIADLHFGNISLIKNQKTGQTRIAPLYDLGGAYGSSRTGQNLILTGGKSTLFLVYFLYNDLDPSWDYSWYNPDVLIGVEDEIKEVLSKSEFYTPQIIDKIIDVYHHQKATLDEMAGKNK